jgi:3',5'-cyclic AMP phosphodiesterase CpdA
VLAAVLELAHGLRRSTAAGQRAAWIGGAITLAMGLLLINAPYFASTAIGLFFAGWFGLDGVRHLAGAFRRKHTRVAALAWLLAGIGNLLVCVALLVLRGQAVVAWTVAAAGAARIFGSALHIFLSPVFTAGDSGDTTVADLVLTENPELLTLARSLAEEESARASIDRGWILGFIATLFAIHVGRMGFDRTFLGVISPGFATLGDLAIALLLAFVVIIPCSVLWRRLTRAPERWLWRWCLKVPEKRRGWGRRTVGVLISHRLRLSIRLVQARYSVRTALSRGLQIGLPLAAIIAATVPMWGISWYFDTENWAAGLWNSWAEERTDTWREAMIRAVSADELEKVSARAFAISPPGATGDFSFVVIGDTGEGDASQHSLRATYLDVVRHPEVKFVVISSDVVYPTGSMRHYESNFWLPFMGTSKPVYAIPGNHDWFDALEGFAATFLEPDAARAAMRARVVTDNRLTTTTDGRIEELIAMASRLKKEYGVPTQLQKGPFFQFQTDSFALFAVDTGVARRLDPAQFAWLANALNSARGKAKMAILGHPIYAGGASTVGDNADFAALHAMLRDHDVSIVMAGDTHDLEYYAEQSDGSSKTAHHFVNGGGGAYLSFGTALDWPARPATAEWAFYPNRDQVVAKVEATTPVWKRPAWWWTKRIGAWPFSPEWLSAAFDANVAPFYQSFIEVRVEPSEKRIRLLPYGVHGRLRWGDLEASRNVRPAGVPADALAQWVVEMPGE